MVFYVVIVNYGQSGNIIKLLKNNHSSAQFVQIGEGTATKQVRSILNIEDNTKEIIYSFMREEYVQDFKMELFILQLHINNHSWRREFAKIKNVLLVNTKLNAHKCNVRLFFVLLQQIY